MLLLAVVGAWSLSLDSVAKTPPMGWNSWDCFGAAVTEEQVRQNADYMAKHLKKHGWSMVTVDIEWYVPSAKGWDYKPGVEIAMDAFGRPMPAENRFPSGFKTLSRDIHKLGLKFGVHLLRGIPRKAVEHKLPVLGTNVTADQIADPNSPCPWNPTMWGVSMKAPGAQEYYDSIFKLLAEWQVDFVKVDDISRPYHQPEIEAIRKAIDKCGRPMVLSLSPGETPLDAGPHVEKHANMWRISDDFWDHWPALLEQFERLHKWTPYRGPGHWPDADMLPLGAVRQGQKDDWTHFTQEEQRTLMTLWCIAKSPLILGGHLPKNDAFTLSLLTNDEVLEVNQKSKNSRQYSRSDPQVEWIADAPGKGAKYVALFNVGDDSLEVEVDLRKMGFKNEPQVRDLWRKEDLGKCRGDFSTRIPAHGSRLLRIG